jgi:hypothetical protein
MIALEADQATAQSQLRNVLSNLLSSRPERVPES